MSTRNIDDSELEIVSGAGRGLIEPQPEFREVQGPGNPPQPEKLTVPPVGGGGSNTGIDLDNQPGSGNTNITQG